MHNQQYNAAAVLSLKAYAACWQCAPNFFAIPKKENLDDQPLDFALKLVRHKLFVWNILDFPPEN